MGTLMLQREKGRGLRRSRERGSAPPWIGGGGKRGEERWERKKKYEKGRWREVPELPELPIKGRKENVLSFIPPQKRGEKKDTPRSGRLGEGRATTVWPKKKRRAISSIPYVEKEKKKNKCDD